MKTELAKLREAGMLMNILGFLDEGLCGKEIHMEWEGRTGYRLTESFMIALSKTMADLFKEPGSFDMGEKEFLESAVVLTITKAMSEQLNRDTPWEVIKYTGALIMASFEHGPMGIGIGPLLRRIALIREAKK